MEKADDYLDLEVLETQGEEGATKIVSTYLTIALNEVDETAAEEALDVLLRMSATQSIASHLTSSLPLLSGCLKVFMEEPSVVEVILAVIKNVAKQEGSAVSFTTPDNVELIVKAMTEHEEGEETLMEYGCLLVEVLAQGNPTGAKILIDGGIEDRLNKASTVITNVRNQKYVVTAQAALSQS